MTDLQQRYKAAVDDKDAEPTESISAFRSIVLDSTSNDADSIKVKEQAIQKLADLYAKQKDAAALKQLLVELRPLFSVVAKAKTAKIVRTIIEAIAKVPDSTQLQVRVLPFGLCTLVAGWTDFDWAQLNSMAAGVVDWLRDCENLASHNIWSRSVPHHYQIPSNLTCNTAFASLHPSSRRRVSMGFIQASPCVSADQSNAIIPSGRVGGAAPRAPRGAGGVGSRREAHVLAAAYRSSPGQPLSECQGLLSGSGTPRPPSD